jgi:hypothetical protein
VLDRASVGWRGFTMTPVGLRLLQDMRRNLHDPLPNCRGGIRQSTPKPAWHQPIPLPSNRNTAASERDLCQAGFTVPGRHPLLMTPRQEIYPSATWALRGGRGQVCNHL